jgi:uncharacterized membrane protein
MEPENLYRNSIPPGKTLHHWLLNILAALPSILLAIAYRIVTPRGGVFMGMVGTDLADIITMQLWITIMIPLILLAIVMNRNAPEGHQEKAEYVGTVVFLLGVPLTCAWLLGWNFFINFFWLSFPR